jgi:palmitoyltransferase ZDHHC9/14/18
MIEEEKKEKNPLIPNLDKNEIENTSNSNNTNENPTDTSINVNTSSKIILFTFLGKKRRFPSYNDINGFICTLSMFLLGTLSYIIMLYQFIKKIDPNNKNFYLILIIVSIITFIITIISFIDVSTSIPGYQRGEKISEKEFTNLSPTKTIKNKTFILKYCHTCKLIKDIRTFHCKYCGICIERHDHHCTFVSNCIGKKNHKLFFYFLIICLFHLLPIVIFDGYVIYKVSKLEEEKEKEKSDLVIINVLCGFVIVFAGFFLCFVITMIISHIQLISKNQTTNEAIRNKDNYIVFNRGCCNNWKEVFCEN